MFFSIVNWQSEVCWRGQWPSNVGLAICNNIAGKWKYIFSCSRRLTMPLEIVYRKKCFLQKDSGKSYCLVCKHLCIFVSTTRFHLGLGWPSLRTTKLLQPPRTQSSTPLGSNSQGTTSRNWKPPKCMRPTTFPQPVWLKPIGR